MRRVLMVCASLLAGEAYADCSSPAGVRRSKEWNDTLGKYQYCNGTSWQDFSGAGAVNDLSDVSATAPISGSLLLFDGSEWESITLATLKTLLDSGAGGGSGGGGSSASCPTGFAFIPGSANIDSQANGWCVSKYEMTPHDPSGWGRDIEQGYRFDQKGSDATVAAKAGQHPINLISRNEAQAQCSGDLVDANGNTVSNGKLITVELWSKLAQDITDVADNWSGGSVGNGYMSRGHANNSPADILATAADTFPATTGMTNAVNEYWSRTYKTSQGDLIWDLAGNVYEWFYDLHDGGADNWRAHNQGTFAFGSTPLEASQGNYSQTQGVGRIYSGANGATPGSSLAAYFSGSFISLGSSGVWASAWGSSNSPSTTISNYIGFRCIAPAQ